MRSFAIMIAGWMWLGCATAGERPFSLGEEPTYGVAGSEALRRPSKSANWVVEDSDPATRPLEESQLQPGPVRRTQWLMFTAEWCSACRAARADFEPWLRKSGWRIDDSPAAHIKLIDGDADPDLLAAMEIRMYPTFVLLRDGVELFRQEGYPGRAELVRRYAEAAASSSQPVGAIHVGTLTGQRKTIAAVIESLRPLLSDGGTLTMRLDRRGESPAVIPLGERISVAVGNPLVMRYTLSGDVLTCRFEEPLPRGRISWGLPLEQPVSAVSASVAEVVLKLPRAPDLKWRVAP